MGRKRNRQSDAFFRSMLMNKWDYTQYEDMLLNIALSRFDWQGLPDTCDQRYLERALLFNGKAIYMREPVMGIDLTLKCVLTGKFDVYGIPTMRKAYGENGYTAQVSAKESVIIWNNLAHRPSFQWLTNFAMRLYDLDRTIDVNARAQKTPVLITCEESERLSFENIYAKYDGNQPVIYGTKGLSPDSLQVMKTDAPYVSDKIYQLKVNIWNEAMSCLGVANLAMQKKERLISSEIDNQMGGTLAQRYSFIETRQQAAEQINKMFGTNITVSYRDGDINEQGEDAPILAINTAEQEENAGRGGEHA